MCRLRNATRTHGVVLWPVSCLSVCLSQAGIVSKRLNGSIWFLVQRIPSACPVLCFNGIRVSLKIIIVVVVVVVVEMNIISVALSHYRTAAAGPPYNVNFYIYMVTDQHSALTRQ